MFASEAEVNKTDFKAPFPGAMISMDRPRQVFLEAGGLASNASARGSAIVSGDVIDTIPPEIVSVSFTVDVVTATIFVQASVADRSSTIVQAVLFIGITTDSDAAYGVDVTTLLVDGAFVYPHEVTDDTEYHYWLRLWDSAGNSSNPEFIGSRSVSTPLAGMSAAVSAGGDVSFLLHIV